MAKLDLANMYLTLGLALDTRKYFGFCNKGVRKRHKRMPFGAKLGAAVLSAFMAEVLTIAAFFGVKTVINYMDDFFIVGQTYAECLSNLKVLISILTRHGWTIAEDKTTMPSQLYDWKYLGRSLTRCKTVKSTLQLARKNYLNGYRKNYLNSVKTYPCFTTTKKAKIGLLRI